MLCHRSRLALNNNCLGPTKKAVYSPQIQSQALGDLQPALHVILDIPILGVFRSPPPVPLEASIRYLCISCSCSTTCPQTMESKLFWWKAQVCNLLPKGFPQTAIAYLARFPERLAFLGCLNRTKEETLVLPRHACHLHVAF